MAMWSVLPALFVLGYLPGALLVRVPTRGRAARAELPAEERFFWAVVLSLAVSSTVALLLAAVGQYSLTRVLIADVILSLGVVALGRGRLRFGGAAARPGATVLLPVLIAVLGFWLYTPPGELLVGGKDPGVYMNEGIQVAQRGSLVITDPVVAAVPAETRDLFFPSRGEASYEGLRFMGFFVLDTETGLVEGQFPHLYPIWIALGYGLDGPDGARLVVTVCAVAGLLAVYFTGAWLFGRTAAFAACALLALNVAEVWFGRYSNSEVGFQALVFAGLLAWARAREHGGRFFAAASASLFGLAFFLRLETVLIPAAIAGAALITPSESRRLPRAFAATLAAWLAVAALYYGLVMRPYADQLVGFVRSLATWQLALGVLAALAALAFGWWQQRSAMARRLRPWVPTALAAVVMGAAVYAFFFREAGGRLAPHDANALRTFGAYYVLPYGLLAAVLGFALTARKLFWRLPLFFLTLAIFALFFFYKVRIVPEHFWMARRFLPVILPGAALMIGALAFAPLATGFARASRVATVAWTIAGAIGMAALGWQYWQRSAPLLAHVEYAGATAHLEGLARRFGDDDLLLVESRQASDLHVLALPLAYTYGRNVLVLDSRVPDKPALARFLGWAQARYQQVYFMGGGGTDLISPRIAVEPVAGERFQLPEYDSPLNEYPRGPRMKEFDFGIYRFVPPGSRPPVFALDIGAMDDVYAVRFHAKETHAGGTTFRWSRDESYVSVLPPANPTGVTLWLSDGGRPAAAPPARVSVYLEDQLLGSEAVADGFQPYTFRIPPDLAARLSEVVGTVQLKIASTTWTPREVLGVPDDRDLGVMVDRLEVR